MVIEGSDLNALAGTNYTQCPETVEVALVDDDDMEPYPHPFRCIMREGHHGLCGAVVVWHRPET